MIYFECVIENRWFVKHSKLEIVKTVILKFSILKLFRTNNFRG